MQVRYKDAKALIAVGAITRVHLVRGLDAGTWEIVFVGKNETTVELRTERGEVRGFQSLDVAVRTLEQLGCSPSTLTFDI